MDRTCLLCEKIFFNKSSLQRHLRTVKGCASKETKMFECKYCDRNYNQNTNFQRHLKVCKIKKAIEPYQKIISIKEEEIESANKKATERIKALTKRLNAQDKKLKEYEEIIKHKTSQIEEFTKQAKAYDEQIVDLKIQLAEKRGMLSVKTAPKTINNNNNYVNQKLMNISCSTIDPFTIETVKKAIDAGSYTFQQFKRGADGIVNFISDIISTDDGQKNYACSDISRNRCHRLIETREWETDNGATFIKKVLDELRPPALEYNQRIIDMWNDTATQELGDELRERTRSTFNGIAYPESNERKELFNKIRSEVKKLASI